LLDPVWGNGEFLVQRAQEVIHSLQGGARASSGTDHGVSLTPQRGPPLRVPLPFSGFGLVMAGAATGLGSSSDGSAPLLAVLVTYLFAVLFKDLSRACRAFLRPGTIAPLALERPG
jgi:hypothetical protein